MRLKLNDAGTSPPILTLFLTSYTEAAIRGNWQPMVKEVTDAYENTTSVRQLIEGERNLQGFMAAYLSLNPYYLTAPELELNHGYCDFFRKHSIAF